MLLSLLTGKRGQALHSLNVSDFRFSSHKCVFVFSEKHKHTKPGVQTEPATILEFPDNHKLCLVKHVYEYFNRTRSLQQDIKLFISCAKPHDPVSRDRFSRWVKLVLDDSGTDTSRFKPIAHWRRFKIRRPASTPGDSAGRASDTRYQRLYSHTSNTPTK